MVTRNTIVTFLAPLLAATVLVFSSAVVEAAEPIQVAAALPRTSSRAPVAPDTAAPLTAPAPTAKPLAQSWGRVSGGTVNIRSGPGTQNEIITSLNAGTFVKARASHGAWLEIEWPEGVPAYVAKQSIQVANGNSTVKVNGAMLRQKGNAKAPVLARLTQGSTVVVTGEENGWYKVKPPEAVRAYIHGKYVMLGVQPPAVEVKASPAATALIAQVPGKNDAPATAPAKPTPAPALPAEKPDLAASIADVRQKLEDSAPRLSVFGSVEPLEGMGLPDKLVVDLEDEPALWQALNLPENIDAAAQRSAAFRKEAEEQAAARAKAEADEQARATANKKAAEAREAARVIAEAKAKAKADADADAQARLVAEKKATEEREAARVIADAKAKADAEAQSRLVAEKKAAEEREAARVIAEAKAKADAEAALKAKADAAVVPAVATTTAKRGGEFVDLDEPVGKPAPSALAPVIEEPEAPKTIAPGKLPEPVAGPRVKEPQPAAKPQPVPMPVAKPVEAPAPVKPVAEDLVFSTEIEPAARAKSKFVLPSRAPKPAAARAEIAEIVDVIDVQETPIPSKPAAPAATTPALPEPVGAAPASHRLPEVSTVKLYGTGSEALVADGVIERRSVTPVEGATHVLVRNGLTLHYLTAGDGVDLDSYAGRRVSVTGAALQGLSLTNSVLEVSAVTARE